jgi:hypothetical protein
MRLRRGCLILLCLACPLAGCGRSVILHVPTERILSNFVYRHTGYYPRDVRCPSGVPAKVGGSFQCRFTGPDGSYTADMLITSVHGQRVTYDIRTRRTGGVVVG